VYGTGEQRRCFCMVHDTVRAVMGLMAEERAWGQPFNIGSEDEITMLGLAQRVKERLGSTSSIEIISYEVAYGEGFEDMERRQPDTSKIRDLIGWKPEHGLDQIIDATAAHLRAGLQM